MLAPDAFLRHTPRGSRDAALEISAFLTKDFRSFILEQTGLHTSVQNMNVFKKPIVIFLNHRFKEKYKYKLTMPIWQNKEAKTNFIPFVIVLHLLLILRRNSSSPLDENMSSECEHPKAGKVLLASDLWSHSQSGLSGLSQPSTVAMGLLAAPRV